MGYPDLKLDLPVRRLASLLTGRLLPVQAVALILCWTLPYQIDSDNSHRSRNCLAAPAVPPLLQLRKAFTTSPLAFRLEKSVKPKTPWTLKLSG